MAGAVPKSQSNDYLPGAFPETPATEPQTLSINPLPATDGPGNPIHLAPGEKVPNPSTFTNNTIVSTVKDDPSLGEEQKLFSVTPIPATGGAGNPIHLAPGEPVPDPSTITSNTIPSTVRTDANSYEKPDSIPPQFDPVVTSEAKREANGGMFGLPPISENMIPESSLPIGSSGDIENDPGVTIQSAAPISSTAALAAQVPKEPRGVPEIVTESQKEVNFEPEAAASSEAVQEKKEVEQELLKEVPEQPAAAESSSSTSKLAETVTGGATVTGATFAAATYAAKEKAAELTSLKSPALSGPVVPEIVTESQKEANASPEASANPEAVSEKAAVESELLKEVKTTNEASKPAPTITAETSETAPTLSLDASPLKSSSEPEALNTPAEKAVAPVAVDPRDISPMSKRPTTIEQTPPTVTTGVEPSATEVKSTPAPETPKKEHERPASQAIKGTPDSVGSGASQDTNGKKKRFSFFGKLKGKFHHS